MIRLRILPSLHDFKERTARARCAQFSVAVVTALWWFVLWRWCACTWSFRTAVAFFLGMEANIMSCKPPQRNKLFQYSAETIFHANYLLCIRYLTFLNLLFPLCTDSSTFNDSTFCPHSLCTCFVWIISLYNINWLVCIAQTVCVYCAVRTES
jgi:hypothetical protein